ncbi:hypothetical protein KPSA3_02922 [Pseudomonas syringae pv. actinidiae]|uniref:Uncharacterized protein n=1 Tax=Pseudomonas syringae pv. actinidiae TaxID=103796 RepID=A0AAN4TL38_PSESF|nr:hypothetical protein KPSA3_02922 [Pseudomonas syringae pv. actinidiae]
MLQNRRSWRVFFVHRGAHIKPLRIILPNPRVLSECSASHHTHCCQSAVHRSPERT